MAERLLDLRVRPPRLAILIKRDSAEAELTRVVRFLSQLWGGRYSSILVVDADQPDPLTRFRLRNLRPDFAYGVGINDERWRPFVQSACQPRLYSPLEPSVAEDVREARFEDFIHVDRAVIAMFETRNTRSRFNRPLKVVSADGSSRLKSFCAAVFGVHHPDLAEVYRDEHADFASDEPGDFVDLCGDFAQNWKMSWLDATGFGLDILHHMSAPCEPAVVLVNDVIPDLAQFWNLRAASDAAQAAWIIPVPLQRAQDPALLGKLREWLVTFLGRGAEPNYCVVTSESVSEQDCCAFATRFRSVLHGTPFAEVDYRPPRNRLPTVIPFEYTTTWPAQLHGRKLTLVPPSPRAFRRLGPSDSWFVDVISDTGTGRALKEIELPESPIVPELLNGPCPPRFEHSVIPRFGDGVDSMNMRCSSSKELVSFHIPSPEEILEELLHEHGYDIVHDEKRSSYLPTIRRFGSLHQAAAALSGQTGQILRALLKGPFLPDQIRGMCKLGSGELAMDNYMSRVDRMLARDSERTRRIGRKRFGNYARGDVPESVNLGALLEHWADRSIVKRWWKLGPCPRCKQSDFVERLNIQEPVTCPNCGDRMRFPERIRIGYSLARPVCHSLKEGIIPVALAGRFLHNMTSRSFFWLPGAKFRKGRVEGDMDLLACCDGLVVLGECKSLLGTPGDAAAWDGALQQFLQLGAVAEECKAHVVVLAALTDEFPARVREGIETQFGGRIPYLMLDNRDLDKGHRKVQHGRLRLEHLLTPDFPERVVQRTGGPRQIRFGVAR